MRRLLALLLAVAPAAARPQPAAPAPAPLTLARAIEIALANQPQLAGARAQTRAARARAGQATAGLLPQASGTAGVARTSDSDRWSLGASGSQLLFDFGETWNRARAAGAAADAQAETERTTLQDVILGVKLAWFQVASARDLVGVARETLANRDAHLAQVEGFVKVGTRPEIDLAQARADRANAVVQLIGAENDHATARAQLLQAIGVTGPLDLETSSEPYPPLAEEDGSLDALLAEALAARPEVGAQARQRAAQEATLRSVRGAFAPSLAATARVDGVGARPDALDRTWSAGLTLTWPFLEGGRTRAEVEEARATLATLEAQDEALRQQIRLELEEARLAVRAARASLEASGEVVTSARERLRLAEGRYRAGLGSGIELNDAQVSLTNAEAQEVRARFTLASARARLARALGRG